MPTTCPEMKNLTNWTEELEADYDDYLEEVAEVQRAEKQLDKEEYMRLQEEAEDETVYFDQLAERNARNDPNYHRGF